jgi:hypothetical protein
MPSSSRFTEHIDSATTRQSTSPESDVLLDDILRLSQKSRSSSGSSGGSGDNVDRSIEEKENKKIKRGSRLLTKTRRKV